MVQLFGQMAKEEEDGTSLLGPANILVNVGRHHGLDPGFPSFEKLI
jgi:hypothetical protein